MGLTVHYSFSSRVPSLKQAEKIVEKMRQLALDLPFDKVDNKLTYLGPEVCQTPLEELRGSDNFSFVLDGLQHVSIPWHRKQHGSMTVQPLEMVSFAVVPGPGSEWAMMGLARYPEEIEVIYSPKDDDKFIDTVKDGFRIYWEFSWKKWRKWLERNGHEGYESPRQFEEKRKIKTRLGGWRWRGFCKTQYACENGVQNFLRCHVGLITLLDSIAKLPNLKAEVNDEGKYGRSYYTDDWKVPKPVYTWHEGKYNVKALVEEVGEWNQMIAAFGGALKDAAKSQGVECESPITSFSNFEELEFKGQQQADVKPFLQAMQSIIPTIKEEVS